MGNDDWNHITENAFSGLDIVPQTNESDVENKSSDDHTGPSGGELTYEDDPDLFHDPDTPDQTVIGSIPPGDFIRTWDWRSTGDKAPDNIVQNARDKMAEKVKECMVRGGAHLIDQIPSGGKTYGFIKAIAETDQQGTILTGRGHKEQYQQLSEWCDEFNLSYAVAPSFPETCDTATGDFGEEIREEVMDVYYRGASPKEIHKEMDLPCQAGDHRCMYKVKWESFDPDDVDVVIGHYNHAHVDSVVSGRHVAIDEMPKAYESTISRDVLVHSVNIWLDDQDWLNIDDWVDLMDRGASFDNIQGMKEDQENWAEDRQLEINMNPDKIDPGEEYVLEDPHFHAGVPYFVYTWVFGKESKNGWVRAWLPNGGRGVFDTEEQEFHMIKPPDWQYTRSLIGLDGTPTVDMWKFMLDKNLTYHEILTEQQKRDYLQNGLNIKFIKTSNAIKPYNSEDNIALGKDGTLFEFVNDEYDHEIGLISTRTAVLEYDKHGLIDYDRKEGEIRDGPIDRVRWYGNVLGSNEMSSTRVGIVSGSNHYGDYEIQKWCAYANKEFRRQGKGKHLSYGDWADKVLRHMREHQTFQAAMRFGRDGEGAIVFVHTDTLPEWIGYDGCIDTISTWSDGWQQVLEALHDGHEFGTIDVAMHPAVEIGEEQVRNILHQMADREIVEREYLGNEYTWTFDGHLEGINEHGEVGEIIVNPEYDDQEGKIDLTKITRKTRYYTSYLDEHHDNNRVVVAHYRPPTRWRQGPDRYQRKPPDPPPE